LERLEQAREKLATFGLSARQIRTALATHDPGYLEGNIAVAERDLAAGKVHNLPAYLLAALREDYRAVKALAPAAVKALAPAAVPDAAAPDRVDPDDAPEVRQECLRTQFLTARLQAALDRLSEAERQALEADYVVRLEQGDGFEARLILGLYRKNGLRSKIVESHFRAFARAQLVGTDDPSEFAEYVALHTQKARESLEEAPSF